jgi:hypothetical protein
VPVTDAAAPARTRRPSALALAALGGATLAWLVVIALFTAPVDELPARTVLVLAAAASGVSALAGAVAAGRHGAGAASVVTGVLAAAVGSLGALYAGATAATIFRVYDLIG